MKLQVAELTQDQKDELAVVEITKLVAAGKDINAFAGATLLRLLAQAKKR
jgi:hypothetical protein